MPEHGPKRVVFNIIAVLVFATIYVNCAITLAYQRDTVHSIAETLCGGNLDFVVGKNAVSGIVVGHRREKKFNTNDQVARFKSSPTLFERIAHDMAHEKEPQDIVMVTSFDEMQQFEDYTWPALTSKFGMCDMMAPPAYIGSVLKALYPGWTVCNDLSDRDCATGPGIVRFACPLRCGCDQMFGPYVMTGCPSQLCQQMPMFQKRRTELGQHDIPPESLKVLESWNFYWDSYLEYITREPMANSLKLAPDIVVENFKLGGCHAIWNISKLAMMREFTYHYFCGQTPTYDYRRSIAPWCPATCNCVGTEPLCAP
jgi:hypothetical protein